MKIVIRKTLPTFYEMEFNDAYKELSKFYKTLEVYRNESVLFNHDNVSKIINFFNDINNCEKISNEMIKESGLEGIVSHNSLSIFEIKTSQNSIINQIVIYHALNIIEEECKNYYTESVDHFYKFLKEKLKGENVSKYSLYSDASIRCIDFKKYIKSENKTYNLRLEADYTIENKSSSHFEKFKNERCIYSCNVSNDARMNITISKSY